MLPHLVPNEQAVGSLLLPDIPLGFNSIPATLTEKPWAGPYRLGVWEKREAGTLGWDELGGWLGV